MAFITADRVRETSTTTGTAAFALAGAVGNYQSFSVVGSGNTTPYFALSQAANEWESGIGTFTSGTLSRSTVLSSSTGSKVSFSAGTKDIFVAPPAALVPLVNADNTFTGAQSMPAPSADAHAARRQDVGWEKIAGPVSLAGATSCAVTIPSWAKHIQILAGPMNGPAGVTQDIWLQMMVGGAWINSGTGKYYETGIYQMSTSGLLSQGLTDRNGVGCFVTRFDGIRIAWVARR
jgi:hypothetical protein